MLWASIPIIQRHQVKGGGPISSFHTLTHIQTARGTIDRDSSVSLFSCHYIIYIQLSRRYIEDQRTSWTGTSMRRCRCDAIRCCYWQNINKGFGYIRQVNSHLRLRLVIDGYAEKSSFSIKTHIETWSSVPAGSKMSFRYPLPSHARLMRAYDHSEGDKGPVAFLCRKSKREGRPESWPESSKFQIIHILGCFAEHHDCQGPGALDTVITHERF